MTVSENVADLGGIAAALEAAKKEEDFSAEEFFTNFARIWRMKARTEYMQLLASVDVHAPGKLRTNVQLPNFDEFHKEFDVKERRRHVACPRRSCDYLVIMMKSVQKWMDFFIFVVVRVYITTRKRYNILVLKLVKFLTSIQRSFI